MGEFKTLFWVHELLEAELLRGYFRALRRADQALRADPSAYLGLWERNVPPELRGDHDYQSFGPGELLFFEPYSSEEFDGALAFAEAWGLAGQIRERQYEHLIAPVSI